MIVRWFVVAAVLLFQWPCSALAGDDVDRVRQIVQEAIKNPDDPAKIAAFEATLIEAPPGSGYYLVEGDYLISKDEIRNYLERLGNPVPPVVSSSELIINAPGGKLDYIIDPANRKLFYAVDQGSFPSLDAAKKVSSNFRLAATDWENVCPECGITFQEKPLAEIGDDFRSFVIRYQNVTGGPIARSFFPSTASGKRDVAVYTGYFAPDLGFDAVGVFRHEIGHILGYRHEHIANVPGCATEGTEWKFVTPYTPKSVMHYFCGGRGSFDLAIRDEDAKGHRCVYLTGKGCIH
jgi:hypothetical protein